MSPVTDLTLVVWALLEVGVRVRERVQGTGRRDRDRSTRVLIALTLGAAIGAALLGRSLSQSLPQSVRIAGVVLMWLGLALRVWAIAALGGAFRTTVEVDPDQTVVATGPYTWVRHPSYTGLLLILAGFGLAFGSWLSFVACVLVPLPAIVWRIHVEEAELGRVLGDAYRSYAAGKARLIPRLW